MKKRLRFLYRYFTTTRRWRRWINTQSMLVLVVSAVFVVSLFWTTPLSAQDAQPTATPSAQITATSNPLQTATPTRLPAEFYTNSEQTVGITLAAIVLVLILIAGIVVFLPHKTKP